MISIVVAVYNCEKYIHRCIDSILNQSFNAIEVLLIDDGSTDNSLDICLNYVEKDNRVHVFSKKNGGVSSARNFGMRYAKGKYIQFVDADDWLEANCCRCFYDIMERHKCEIAVSSFCYAYDRREGDPQRISVILPFGGVFYIKEYLAQFNILKRYSPFIGGVWNKIYSLEFLKKNNFLFREDICLHEDSIFNFELLKHMKKIYIINMPLYNYFQSLSEKSLSKRNHENLYLFTKVYYQSYKDLFRFYNSYKEDKRQYLENKCYNAYLICLMNVFHSKKLFSLKINREIKIILKDALFRESIKYVKPTTFLYKIIRFLIKMKSVRILKFFLWAIYLKNRAI